MVGRGAFPHRSRISRVEALRCFRQGRSSLGSPVAVGNKFSISIIGESREHCDEMFAKLSAGGSVTMPLQDTFWGSYYGMWTGRFGINWMVNYALPAD